jgi:hypothetical protein
LVTFAKSCIADARAAGWQPAEFQLDFDAATSKLSGYHTWIRALQAAVAPLPMSFTALPDWLRSAELKAMAQQTQRYVLQVHGIQRARVDDATPHLLEAATVLRWVAQAEALGVPFRVALPTYRTAVGFNAAGKIIGLDSEGPARAWPTGTNVVTYISPAKEIASLIHDWTAQRPGNMTGVIWYRLPIVGEQRNWTWSTLTPVMAGRAPLEQMVVAQEGANPVDLTLQNTGEAESTWPAEIRITLPVNVTLAASDALTGYKIQPDSAEPRKVNFHRQESAAHQLLPPGGRKPLGWLRLDWGSAAPGELKVELR